jgi:hypothetical protein
MTADLKGTEIVQMLKWLGLLSREGIRRIMSRCPDTYRTLRRIQFIGMQVRGFGNLGKVTSNSGANVFDALLEMDRWGRAPLPGRNIVQTTAGVDDRETRDFHSSHCRDYVFSLN